MTARIARRALGRRLPVALLVVLSLSACRRPEQLPLELIGTWVTDEPRYAGRSFTLQAPSTLILQFGAGADSLSIRRIRAVHGKFDSSRNATLYRIVYREGRDDLYFSLYSFTQPARAVRFKNLPEIVWRLDPDSPISQR